MRKIYRIFFLLIVFVFLTTFNPRELDLQLKTNNKFFEVKNIILTNINITYFVYLKRLQQHVLLLLEIVIYSSNDLLTLFI